MHSTDLLTSISTCCESCGRPLDLWCEDCGCPTSCHDFIYREDGGRRPYCLWDFSPCLNEERPVFLAAVEGWLSEMKQGLSQNGRLRPQRNGDRS